METKNNMHACACTRTHTPMHSHTPHTHSLYFSSSLPLSFFLPLFPSLSHSLFLSL